MQASASTGSASKGRDLSQWKEVDVDNDDFLDTAGRQEESNGLTRRARAKRAVTSESWDDDFLFQHDPTPPSTPRRSPSRTPSRASRPTTPMSSQTNQLPSSLPTYPPRPRSPPHRRIGSSPSRSPRANAVAELANPSLDSLVSSLDWTATSEAEEPTLTLATGNHPTPKAAPRVSSDFPHRSAHRSTASTSTARPSTASSQHTALLAHESHRLHPTPRPSPCSSRIPSNATTARSGTPSLTAGSLRSLASLTTTTGDELKTETEDDETEDEHRNCATSPRPSLFGPERFSHDSGPSPPTSPTLGPSISKRWRFGRSRKEPSETKPTGQQRSSGIFGRRTGPRELEEVVTIERREADPLRRSGLPLATRDGQFVVFGRRTRTGADEASQPDAPFQLTAPLSPRPPSHTVPPLPSASNSAYVSGAPSHGDGEDTTEADASEFSGDERFHLPTRLSNHRRRSIAATTRSHSQHIRSPVSNLDPHRPSSPVESILGDRIGKWNSSQVSFASSDSALSHQRAQPSVTDTVSTGYETTRPQDSIKSRKRKLVRKRQVPEIVETSSLPSLGIEEGAGHRPLLSAVSSRSSASSRPSLTKPSPVPGHARSPSLPFAQDSDFDASRRPSFTRQRSSTTPSKAGTDARGEVVDIDPDWLGIVPFPPSTRTSLSSRDTPLRPSPPSPTSRRSLISRSTSGKTHPPVTSRTQAETRAKRNSGSLSQSISNLLSRSASALPLAGGAAGGDGKRGPSPAPSAKSGKSGRTLLSRSNSRKGKDREANVDGGAAARAIPKSPSFSLLKKRSSAVISSARPPQPESASSKSKLTRHGTHGPGGALGSSMTTPPSTPTFLSRNGDSSRPAIVRADSSSPFVQRPPLPVSSRSPSTHSGQSAAIKGQLNTSFKMPRSHAAHLASTLPAPNSTSVSRPIGGTTKSAKVVKKESSLRTRSTQAGHRPSLSLSSLMRSSSPTSRASRVVQVPQPPSLVVHTPPDRPRTAIGTGHPPIPIHADEDDPASDEDFLLPRRNSLSDLRIPARITNAQQKIEEDLERVRQFARGVEDLKALRRQHDQLVQIFVEPCSLANPRHSIDVSTALANGPTTQGVRRVELDYSHWWEQARTLIDLGDGKPREPQRTSPGTLASRRDRCVSMAAESFTSAHDIDPDNSSLDASGPSQSATDFQSLAANGGANTRKGLPRVPSASSIETEASVGARQREMLRGVLAPSSKGASLPSRGPPSPRPGLAVLAPPVPPLAGPDLPPPPRAPSPPKRAPFNHQTPSSATSTRPTSNASRRVSRAGVSGIREFLLRLRHRAVEELANSVGTLPPPAASAITRSPSITAAPPRRSVSDPTSRPITPAHSRRPTPSSLVQHVAASTVSPSRPRQPSHSSSSDAEEDWDAELASASTTGSLAEPEVASRSLRRSRTVSAGHAPPTPQTKSGTEMMALTTENMPLLLDKVEEVRANCEICIDLLKGLTR
ncbi:hypothetical protein JCM11491_002682 [Sporobolomyces phaffii]